MGVAANQFEPEKGQTTYLKTCDVPRSLTTVAISKARHARIIIERPEWRTPLTGCSASALIPRHQKAHRLLQSINELHIRLQHISSEPALSN